MKELASTMSGQQYDKQCDPLADEPPYVFALANDESTRKRTRAARRVKAVKLNSTAMEINQWHDYVEGRGPKPMYYAPTLISVNRPEKAANKPLVECLVEDRRQNVLFDTGAEINVIDMELVKSEKNAP